MAAEGQDAASPESALEQQGPREIVRVKHERVPFGAIPRARLWAMVSASEGKFRKTKRTVGGSFEVSNAARSVRMP